MCESSHRLQPIRALRPAVCGLVLLMVAGCAERTVPDPIIALNTPSLTPSELEQAMATLDAGDHDAAAVKALEGVLARPGFTVDIREQALNTLAKWDEKEAKTALRRTLPRSEAWEWVGRASEIIAERNWVDLSPALISSWARRNLSSPDELKRPEYLALCKLHGADNVTEVVYQSFVESRKLGEQNYRIRCWSLLVRLGQRERLQQLLVSGDIPADDAMLLDLHAAALELGIVPNNKEEILWLRKLREPSRAEFWAQAVKAVQALPPQRRITLELRDVPVIVAASMRDPELFQMTQEELYQQVFAYTRVQKHHTQESDYEGYTDNKRQRLNEYQKELTWGDLAAMEIAIRAMQVPEVVSHLFDFADRDRKDETTEYGGVIAMDAKDRFEIREFIPTVRSHDQEFLASQAMFDALYTSVFHFHLHVQHMRNDKYAGPGFGDNNFADNARMNCLVFTSINENTLNVDYYRHDRVVVDLGDIKRP